MSNFPEEWLSELLARNDIVSVIGEYVPLKEKNRRFWGCCPFHNEKTPSFSVNTDKQFYYCFGCHVGGNVIHFIMEYEKVSFVEAVKILADRANFPLPEQADDEEYFKKKEKRDRYYAMMREAALFYYHILSSDADSLGESYFAHRDIDQNTIVSFGLGYAPAKWDGLKKHLLQKNYTEEDMLACGLLKQKGNRTYDAFRGRVMFPIITPAQRVVGFGARALGDEQPKYINSSETSIFSKRHHLFGLNMLKSKRVDYIILVEGYMDVIGLYQFGIYNAVASLGTAFTTEQARLLKRYTSTVYFAYDGDSAGQSAIIKGLPILLQEELLVKVISMPTGIDPDELIRLQGTESFDALREQALSHIDFRLSFLRNQHSDSNMDYAKQASQFIATLPPLQQEEYYWSLSRETGFSADALRQEGLSTVQEQIQLERKENNIRAKKLTQKKGNQRTDAEHIIIRALWENAELRIHIKNAQMLLRDESNLALLDFLQKQGDTTTELSQELMTKLASILAMPALEDTAWCFTNACLSIREMNAWEEIETLKQESQREDIDFQQQVHLAEQLQQKIALVNTIRNQKEQI